jgi:hypothetical protein
MFCSLRFKELPADGNIQWLSDKGIAMVRAKFSCLHLPLLTVACSVLTSAVAYAEAVTTRIETRPYYGATVTIEQGVRVWRPLPPHDRIIINPGAKASINFDIKSGQPSIHNNRNGSNRYEE